MDGLFIALCLRKQLILQKGYKDMDLPKRRSVSSILNRLGYRLKIVKKNKPLKKVPETDAIFALIHEVNREADQNDSVVRISMDAKASVWLGPFSRGGSSRVKAEAADHDFEDYVKLTPFNILLPKHDVLFISFAESKVTGDYMWDRLV